MSVPWHSNCAKSTSLDTPDFSTCLSVTSPGSFPAPTEPFASTGNTFENATSVLNSYLECVGECGRVKCKKYDQQSSMEETLQELERPAADDSQQSGPEEDGETALVQRTPSLVTNLRLALHAFKQMLSFFPALWS